MKIYTKIQFNMDDGEVTHSESFEYEGPVSECKGSSQTINSYDPVYNAGMLAISEEQQAMAKEYYDWYKETYQPYEEAQITANTEMLDPMTQQQIAESEYEAAKYKGLMDDSSGQSLLSLQQDTERKALQATNSLIGKKTEVASAAYDQALSGLDVNSQVNQARADVTNSYAGATQSLNRDLARTGGSTSGAGYQSALAGLARDRAKSTATAMTSARNTANQTNFNRLTTAAGLGV